MKRKTREQRQREQAQTVFYTAVAVVLLVIFAAVTVDAARKAEEPTEPCMEYQLYIDSQTGDTPDWEALEEALAAESGEEEPEAPFEEERSGAALLAMGTKIENVTVTHYCICKKCCGKDESHPAYGITASGRAAAPGTSVAVDPDVIPLGSDVLVDYGDGVIHYYRADDTGGAVKGNHIDLCMESHEAAWNAGKKMATVWWVPEGSVK